MDTKPSSDYHSDPVRNFNAEAKGAAPIDLSEGGLIAAARQATGIDFFSNEFFREGLAVFLRSIEGEAELTPFGRQHARAETIGSLRNRLWSDACTQANPKILARRISAPIVITGHHRSGTTRLQRMLSADPNLRGLKAWEGFNPAPRPGLPDHGKAERFREIDEGLTFVNALFPGFVHAHPMAADWEEEDMLLMMHAFCNASLFFAYRNPGYYDWFKNCDKKSAYADMRDKLKILNWSSEDPEDKRWVLKNPTHMMDLGPLMATFPDAKVIFSHRDPVKTAGSLMSLRWTFSVQLTEQPLRAYLRDSTLDLCETMARRTMEQREAMIPASQRLDVSFDEMNRDWRPVMRRIYEFAELDFTQEAEQAMAEWIAGTEAENLHGGHRYALEDFGTTAGEVAERMRFYREWADIPST